MLRAGKAEVHQYQHRIAVDIHRTLDDGADSGPTVLNRDAGPLLFQLQEEYDVQTIFGSYLGITDRRQADVEIAVERFANEFNLEAKLITVDQHAGLPFGRPGLANSRPDLSEESAARHEHATGGKDFVCYQEGACALFDDSRRNIDPAKAIGVHTYKVDNRRRDRSLVACLNSFARDLFGRDLNSGNRTIRQLRPEENTVSAVKRRLRRPVEAPAEEKEDHLRDRRQCWNCGERGHGAENCPEPPNQQAAERRRSDRGKGTGKGRNRHCRSATPARNRRN